MQRQSQAGFWVAGFLPLALSCAGCLVTNELDFPGNLNAPTAKRISPPPFWATPSKGDDECTQLNFPDSLAFKAAYFDRDVDQQLYVIPYVNGLDLRAPANFFVVNESPDRTPEHAPTLVCIPRTLLSERCNRVQLFVSDEFTAVSRPLDALLQDPEVDSLEWYLSPPAGDSPGSPGMPNTGFADCLPPDGGT